MSETHVFMPQIIRDFCIVKVKDVFKDETNFEGANGMKILMDTTFNPQKYTNNCGIVESIPIAMTREPIEFGYHGVPKYHENAPMVFKTNQEIQREVRVGDKVYFNYNALKPDHHERLYNSRYLYRKAEPDENGKMHNYLCFRITYNQIFAAVRYEKTLSSYADFDWRIEKKLKPFSVMESDSHRSEDRYEYDGNIYKKTVQMIGSWTFIEPDVESWEDILVPVPETLNGVPVLDHLGRKVMKPKDQWIQTKLYPQTSYLSGWVRYVGSPLIGNVKELEEGMYVHYRPGADTVCSFEGKDYHRMMQTRVVGYVPYKKAI